MTTTEATGTDRAEAFAERLFTQFIAGMELLSTYLGRRLGLYDALDAAPGSTPEALAAATGVHPRYVREWLEQQAVSGTIEVSDPEVEPYGRHYSLPLPHGVALLEADSTLFVAPLADMLHGTASVVGELLDAYRSGEGVAYQRYGAVVRDAIAGMNRPVYLNELASWVAAMPDVDQRLRGSVRPKILDLGCGTGWSSIALARAYPTAHVDAIDLDDTSIAQARRNAGELTARIDFVTGDAASLPTSGYELACVFEALHDMADPVAVLSQVRDALAPGGAILVADERVAAQFAAPGDELERLNYAFSVLHCLPATRAESPVVEAGMILRADVLRGYAKGAGLPVVEVLPVDNFLWRLYRLDTRPSREEQPNDGATRPS